MLAHKGVRLIVNGKYIVATIKCSKCVILPFSNWTRLDVSLQKVSIDNKPQFLAFGYVKIIGVREVACRIDIAWGK